MRKRSRGAAMAVALILRVSILCIILFTTWTTITWWVDSMRGMEQNIRMGEVAQYVESKVLSVMLQLRTQGSEAVEYLYLPKLDRFYTVGLLCDNGELVIDARSETTGGHYSLKDYINCTSMTLNGVVFAGDRFLYGNKSDTGMTLSLRNYCTS